MTADLTWSKADTHCVWCAKRMAMKAEWDQSHDEHDEPEDQCWCLAFCWGDCDERRHFGARDLGVLRATVEAQEAVIRRAAGELRRHAYVCSRHGEPARLRELADEIESN